MIKRIAISLKKEYWHQIIDGQKPVEFRKYTWIIRQVFTFPEGRRPMAYYKKKNGQPITGWPQTFIELSR